VFFCVYRLSTFTNDKNIVHYISQFAPEAVVPDIDSIKFIATDRATSYPLSELDFALSKLKPLKKKYDLLTKSNATPSIASAGEQSGSNNNISTDMANSNIPFSSANGDATNQPQEIEEGQESEEDKEQKEFDSLRVSTKEFPGFTKIGPDLYSKMSNPCFICNESAVIFYTKYNAKNLKNTTAFTKC
jgi:hypothetical protein